MIVYSSDNESVNSRKEASWRLEIGYGKRVRKKEGEEKYCGGGGKEQIRIVR